MSHAEREAAVQDALPELEHAREIQKVRERRGAAAVSDVRRTTEAVRREVCELSFAHVARTQV